MSKIGSIMNVGKRSLMNSQTGLQTVSHNIANKTTEGYTRQRVDFKTSPPVQSYGPHQVGTGANVGEVLRINNPHLEKQLELESQKMGFLEGNLFYMRQVENVFNDENGNGINHFLGQFFNAFRDLSNNPESTAIRTQVKEAAESLTKDLKRTHLSLIELQRGVDREIEVEVEEINRMTEEISQLNKKIVGTEIQGFGAHANDYRDRRDLLVKKLSEKINIKVAEGTSGAININAGGTLMLVTDTTAQKLETSTTPEKGPKREGSVDILYRSVKDGTPYSATQQIKGGKLGAIIEVRDQTINQLLNRLDTIAYTLADKVNEAHLRGYDQYGKPAGAFFEQPAELKNASYNLELSKVIRNDPTRIGTAAVANAPGDNRVAQVIAALQHSPIMPDGVTTMEEFYKGIVGDVGVMNRKSREVHEHQKNVMQQMQNLRESISGVSLDEETVNMINFQRAFDASAKLIKTTDEMLETVINLKR